MIRDITIHAVLNGFEVKVGCQALVFTDVTEMLKEIRRYLKNSEQIEKEYLEKALNAKHIAPTAQPSPITYTNVGSDGSSSSDQWISNA